MKGSNTYINLINGVDIEMSNEKFEETYLPFEVFCDDFFSHRNIKLENMKKNRTEGKVQFDIVFNGIKYHAAYLNIKNSGKNIFEKDKYSKRFQIDKTIESFDDNIPHFVIGSYNTLDKKLYFVVELKDYIKNVQNNKSYSSLWLEYGDICYTYERGFSRHIDAGTNRVVIGIDNSHLSELEDDELMNKVFYCESYCPNSYDEKQKNNSRVIFEKNDTTVYNEGIRLKRNNDLKKKAFERENYTCELCGTSETFESKNGNEYFEGHHLIMYNLSSQSKYKYSLDIEENIICLCPMCHRKIHYASENTISECVTKLLKKHMELSNIFELENYEKVLDNYIKYERDDDNE